MIYDLATNHLIDVVEGRTKEDVIPFLQSKPEIFGPNIKAVAMDMSRSYSSIPTVLKIHTRQNAEAFLDYFKELVNDSGIPELQTFCKTLDHWREKILNYYDFKITNGPTEGLNHKIKNIKRRAYGYRNKTNFLIRLKLECA